MCGRFALDAETDELIREFVAAGGDPQDWRPSWNIKPTDRIPVVFESAAGGEVVQRRVELARWSLVPPWAREPRLKFPTFNARSEGVTEKPTWRGSVPSRRCLVPASGYFEWLSRGSSKSPHFVHGAERLAFAGLFSWWRAHDEDDWLLTATILTMAAEPVPHMAALHDRLPVLLPRDWWSDWLAPDVAGDQSFVDAAVAAAIPLAERLEFHEVAPLRGDGPELIRPISPPAG